MKIVDSNISLASSHVGEQRWQIEASQTNSFHQVLQAQSEAETSGPQERLQKMLYSLLEAILAAMEGRKCRSSLPDCRQADPQAMQSATTERQVDWRWQISERYSESERTTVSGAGQIRTADGRCLDFDYCLAMDRQFTQESRQNEQGSYVLHDPLVINFDGKAAELDGQQVKFDLDADGCQELLPGLGASTAYLVLDRNANGRIDDGSELFGSRSGDGFADLAKFDADGNGWIDESDPEFANLRLWNGGEDKQRFSSLAEKGVGALWLGSVDSPFAAKNSAGQLLGEIRASGLWLAEDGRVGSMQQIDLATSKTDQAA